MAPAHRGILWLSCWITAALLVGVVAGVAGCTAPTRLDRVPVRIADQLFMLEVAAEPAVQDRGLGGRHRIDDDGGMIFIFPDEQDQAFVMRNCAIPIDILYLDSNGRVLSSHAMRPEPPRAANERENDPDQDAAYNARLRAYPSGGPCRFAVEVSGGTIQRLGVRDGDLLDFDAQGLIKRAHSAAAVGIDKK